MRRSSSCARTMTSAEGKTLTSSYLVPRSRSRATEAGAVAEAVTSRIAMTAMIVTGAVIVAGVGMIIGMILMTIMVGITSGKTPASVAVTESLAARRLPRRSLGDNHVGLSQRSACQAE